MYVLGSKIMILYLFKVYINDLIKYVLLYLNVI